MPAKKYLVELTEAERDELTELVNKGKAAAYKRKHAEILLKADQGIHGLGWPDKRIAEAFDVGLRTVERVRQRLVENGLASAIERAKQTNRKAPKLDGEQEAHLIALICQEEPPAGHARWTLRLLAEQMVALDYVDTLSHETVRRVLKKHYQTLAT
jgi:transposase